MIEPIIDKEIATYQLFYCEKKNLYSYSIVKGFSRTIVTVEGYETLIQKLGKNIENKEAVEFVGEMPHKFKFLNDIVLPLPEDMIKSVYTDLNLPN